MKIPFFAHRILCLLVAMGAVSAPAFGQQSKTLHRELDPVVAQGEIVQPLWRYDISRLRLYAYKGSRWQPIPYQIDKVGAGDNYFIALNKSLEIQPFERKYPPSWWQGQAPGFSHKWGVRGDRNAGQEPAKGFLTGTKHQGTRRRQLQSSCGAGKTGHLLREV